VTAKVVARWVERFVRDGSAGMADRSSRPKMSPRQITAAVAGETAMLRRRGLTGKHIAQQTGVRRRRSAGYSGGRVFHG
jgi:hypothetical protein